MVGVSVGVGNGSAHDGDVVRLGIGERSSSSLSSQSLNSSSSFLRLLVFFAGGEAISSDDRRGSVLVGDSVTGVAARVGGSVRLSTAPSTAAMALLGYCSGHGWSW